MYPLAALLVRYIQFDTYSTMEISVPRFLCAWIPARFFQNILQHLNLLIFIVDTFNQYIKLFADEVFPNLYYLIFRDESESPEIPDKSLKLLVRVIQRSLLTLGAPNMLS